MSKGIRQGSNQQNRLGTRGHRYPKDLMLEVNCTQSPLYKILKDFARHNAGILFRLGDNHLALRCGFWENRPHPGSTPDHTSYYPGRPGAFFWSSAR